MKTYTISRLGRLFGLSRSTLLYYDRIGILRPSARTPSGYRTYTDLDCRRLERICHFRQAGLALDDIRTLLASDGVPTVSILQKRLQEINEEILSLKAKQGLLSRMLKGIASELQGAQVDKEMWVEMLRAAGMDDDAMDAWHAEFEARAPEAHQEFLLSLGIPDEEVAQIRMWSRKAKRYS